MDNLINSDLKSNSNNNSNNELILRQCLVLLDKYNDLITVMSNNCKCDENIENKLIFNDLLNKYKTIITNNELFIENINCLQHNYCKFGHNLDFNDNNYELTDIIIEENIEQNNIIIDDNINEQVFNSIEDNNDKSVDKSKLLLRHYNIK
jgi:hypothetical protein